MRVQNPETLTDIIRLCSDGNEEAWHELLDIIGPLIFSICRRSRLARDESFDIFGLVCFDLVKNIHTIKSPDKILPFAATITRRKIYNYYEKMRLTEYFDADYIPALSDEGELAPDLIYENLQKRELLLKALTRLPKKQYRLIKALFFDPQTPSYKEIAQRLNCPLASIGPTRARALEKLARILKQKQHEF